MVGMGRVSRRRFLVGSASLGVAAALQAACGGTESRPSPTVTPSDAGNTPPASGTTPTPPAATLPAADYRSLRNRIKGEVLLPIDAGYEDARLLFNPRFDASRPAAIVRCLNAGDVQQAVLFARKAGVPLATRGGGHSYGGYSTGRGMVIDTRSMNSVSFQAGQGIVTAGSGAPLIDVYAVLAALDQVIPAGTCPTVGLAGLALGGGVGVLDRSLGLTCDVIDSLEIVTADAELRTCSATENPDLFWACRGGGGGNYGIVTSLRLRTSRVPAVGAFTIQWPIDAAETAIAAWQEWAPLADDATWANCVLANRPSGQFVTINGVYNGPIDGVAPKLDAMVRRIGSPIARFQRNLDVMDAMLYEAGCFGESTESCRLQSPGGPGQLGREAQFAASAFYDRALPPAGVTALVDAIRSRKDDPTLRGGAIILDPMGGAINRVAPDATAFVHRDQLFSAQYYSEFNSLNADIAGAAEQWVRTTREKLAPYSTGFAYQNYIDSNQPDYLNAYYGANLVRLKQVKAKYDPDNVFRHAQSIPVG